MMKNVVIFGTDQFAELLSFFIRNDTEYNIVAYTINEAYIKADMREYLGKPIVSYETIEQAYPPAQYDLFICVGYHAMNSARERIFLEAKSKGYHILSYVHPTATVLTDSLGEGTIVMERAVIGAFVKMGIGNVFWADSHVAHHTSMGNFNFYTISVAVAGNIRIGNNCFFGNNCTIRNNISIGDFALIGAGCYVAHDVEAYSVHVPAKSVQLIGKQSLDMKL